MTRGTILHLQRLSTEDGPGLRTTVFFKGCPLRCEWCHNPESLSRALETQWFAVRCLDCLTCVQTCPKGCLTMVPTGLVIDRERCEACGRCVDACPSGAREMLGKVVTVQEVLDELVKQVRDGAEKSLGIGWPALKEHMTEHVDAKITSHYHDHAHLDVQITWNMTLATCYALHLAPIQIEASPPTMNNTKAR